MTTPVETEPLVSVIVPTYNNATLIGETIDSIRSQSYRNLEILIVDDGSTDNTQHVVKEFMEIDTRIRYKKIPNSYSPTARNVGFKEAKGEYVATIDSDDLWPKNKIEIQIQVLKGNPDAVILGCVQRFTDDTAGNRTYGAISYPPPSEGDYIHNLLSMDQKQMVNLNTLCAKRSIICNDGLWDPNIYTAHDWEVWIRLAKKYSFVQINKVLQYYRKHVASVTGNAKWQTALEYQLLTIDYHAPRGPANLWKRLHYRKIRYECYIRTLLYNNQLGLAKKLWLRSALRSTMPLTESGLKLALEVLVKTIRRHSVYKNTKDV